MSARQAWIGLGSNQGDRRKTIESALAMLDSHESIVVEIVSELIETQPIGPPGQGMFLNGAAQLETTLTARELLGVCLGVEEKLGRNRSKSVRWGPRTIDLDVLLYEDLNVNEPGLTIPHPGLHQRLFVLVPLAEIAPDVVHPALGQRIESLLAALKSGSSGKYAGPEMSL